MTDRYFPDLMPSPGISRESLPWWEAALEGRLVVQSCTACKAERHPPAPCCNRCGSYDQGVRDTAGTGVVYTFTVVHKPLIPGMPEPYVVASIELDGTEGLRVVSNLVEIDPSEVRIGLEVEVVFEHMSEELVVPRFRPKS
ncbi:MAG: OB-fold domain-containing protein [Candidatus Binatia bacterium]|nr:OB-fold domain-containing protein [Candidatus Binatia bacterium]